MIDSLIVDLSRLQFALTALYHFLFVPLTLGLTVLIAIMESIYVKSGNIVYKDMARFWTKLFGINFALGVATGLTMEFQFGTNWAYYSHFVGDIFGAPLAIEALVAFFLESTFVGMMVFGWDRMGQKTHLLTSWLTALGTNFSALWILVANGWMQHPTGSSLNPVTVRHEVTSFMDVVLNPVAQAKFLHTVSAGYVCGAIFVLSISAWYLLRNRDVEFAKRSFAVAAVFGLLVSIVAVLFGHESGVDVNKYQPAKMAAIEGHYDGTDGCIDFKVIANPSYKSSSSFNEDDAILSIPCGTSLFNFYTPQLDKNKGETVLGAKQVVEHNIQRVKNGLLADKALRIISDKTGSQNQADIELVAKERVIFDQHKQDWGYAQLLKAFVSSDTDIVNATEDQIRQAAEYTIPSMPVLFWVFRIMVAVGGLLILIFAIAAIAVVRNKMLVNNKFILRVALLALPLPWIAIESGWFVAEYGRQPWAIDGILPTFLAVSGVTPAEIWAGLVGILSLYTLFLIIELYLMIKFAKIGPSSLHTGRYYFENNKLAKE